MTSTLLFGENSNTEKIADENQICREIVRQIMDFQVNQRQILMLIYLLSLEIESVENMRTITDCVKMIRPDVFLTSHESEGV